MTVLEEEIRGLLKGIDKEDLEDEELIRLVNTHVNLMD